MIFVGLKMYRNVT